MKDSRVGACVQIFAVFLKPLLFLRENYVLGNFFVETVYFALAKHKGDTCYKG